jgi:ornithine carbamoyltransferase
MESLLSLMDLTKKDIERLIKIAEDAKKNPSKYSTALRGKTLLMIFEKPSLRTRLSFDVAMKSMGGHTIVIDTLSTPLGEKESIEDTAKVCSRYVDVIMARLFEHKKLVALKENASVPVINGLTDDFHPVQILSDFLTIKEKKGALKGLKLCYLGDALNNVTHSLLIGCALTGIDISIGCPPQAAPKKSVLDYAKRHASSKIVVTSNPKKAISGADIVYTDSWMSYHINPKLKQKRVRLFKPYQVNKKIVKYAKNDYIFMNCLPAMRGYEQTADIIDGKNSIVFDQAENRLHMQKAILLELLK